MRRDLDGRVGGSVLTAAVALMAAHPAGAQPVTGLYVGAGVGYSILSDEPLGVGAVPPATGQSATHARFNGGAGAVGSIGYGLGNGLRAEVEGDWRDNPQSHGPNGDGSERKYGGMANLLYDIDMGFGWAFPYFGGGIGYQRADWSGVSAGPSSPGSVSVREGAGQFAFQGIVGFALPIDWVPGLALTAEYRHLALGGGRTYRGVAAAPTPVRVHATTDANDSFLVGLRYAFDAPGAIDQVGRPPLAPAAEPAATRTYLIFFDWDRADLTPRARDLVAEAVRNTARVAFTRIEVAGYADASGSPSYNQTLSLHRARNVAAEMERWGIPANAIDIHAYGDTRPLIPTAAGVREPQNRRVEIVYR